MKNLNFAVIIFFALLSFYYAAFNDTGEAIWSICIASFFIHLWEHIKFYAD